MSTMSFLYHVDEAAAFTAINMYSIIHTYYQCYDIYRVTTTTDCTNLNSN